MYLSNILEVNMKYIYNQDEISARIFNFVYGCAMHDAILQRAFIGKKDWVAKVEKAKNHLRKYVDCVLNNVFDSQDEHDSFFITTANEICKAINNDKPSFAEDVFSFGNAQKLINITIKHTYSFCYLSPELRENFRYCHCPLDSIMLNEVWKRYEKSIGKDARKRILKNSEFFCQAWGNEGQQGNFQPEIYEFPERYIKYQTAIREIIGEGNLYPIEFDYVVWK